MLKSLISHWKSHKRKPSLLPEDGIILHPEEPSRINPIFEDSDESVVSSQRGPESLDPGTERDLNNPDGQTNDIHLDLVDISIPANTETDFTKSADEENPDDVINQIDIAIDSSLTNEEKLASLERDVNDVSIQYNKELTNVITEENKTTSTSNADKEGEVELNKAPDIVTDETNLATGFQTKTELNLSEHPSEPIRKENHQKEESSSMAPRTEDSAVPSTSREIKSGENKQSKPIDLPTPNLVAEQKMVRNIKTRAIDELIKKFQGQNSANDPAIQTIPSFLHSPTRKSILKAKPFEQRDIPEETAAVSGPEKESLSKIFNFPPPPPIEPLINRTQFGKDDKRDIKSTVSKSPSNASRSVATAQGKTRSDSSLSRNKTVSSNVSKQPHENDGNQSSNQIKRESSVKSASCNEPPKVIRTEQSNALPFLESATTKTEHHSQKETASSSAFNSNADYSLIESEETVVKVPEVNNLQSKPSTSFGAEKPSTTNFSNSKQKSEKQQTLIPNKSSLFNPSRSPKSETKVTNSEASNDAATPVTKLSNTKAVPDVANPVTKLTNSKADPDVATPVTKLTNSKASPDPVTPMKEVESPKSNAEDSGITRGDQVSSEDSPDIPPSAGDSHQHDDKTIPPTPAKRNLKDRRSLKSRNKGCKHCRKPHDDAAPLNMGQYDDYYDVLTGARRSSRRKHSGSWASDLSFEEKELIRRLRSRRDTIRSNATSIKSRNSNYQEGNFHRHVPIRRSMSEDSILNESSVCSCDHCYMILVKDYAYGRASLRGAPPNKVFCTCRNGRGDFLGRRVKFRSDPIPEGSTSPSTPTIPEESSADKEDEVAPPTPQQDTGSKDGKTTDKKEKKAKGKKETYRLVTPWELEEWDMAMRRHLLLKRRKRARYMALMALAMVIFVGLVVTVLMVCLRRKVL